MKEKAAAEAVLAIRAKLFPPEQMKAPSAKPSSEAKPGEAKIPADTKAAKPVAEVKPIKLSAEEEAIFDFLDELHSNHRVADATYSRVLALFGERGVIDLTALCGYYGLLAMVMNVAQTPVPEGGLQFKS